MINFEELKMTVSWDKRIATWEIKEGERTINWDDLERNEQVRILNTAAAIYNRFYKELKEEK